MKNKKCYIAGKIGELAPEFYTEMFEKAEVEVRELGLVPVSPLKLPHNHNKSWNEYMKEDLKALLDCVYLYYIKKLEVITWSLYLGRIGNKSRY